MYKNVTKKNWFCFVLAAVAVPAQGAVPAVHGAQAPGDGGRGEHQRAVPVSAGARLSVAPHRRGRDPEQELLGGEHPHVQRLLHAVRRGRIAATRARCRRGTRDAGPRDRRRPEHRADPRAFSLSFSRIIISFFTIINIILP